MSIISVRLSERELSKTEFLRVLLDIEKWSLNKSECAPKKYRFMINNQLVKYSAEAFNNAKMANSIYVTNAKQLEIREEYFLRAYINVQAFVSQIEVIYSVCSDFMSSNELRELSKMAFDALSLLKGVMKSDKQRFKS